MSAAAPDSPQVSSLPAPGCLPRGRRWLVAPAVGLIRLYQHTLARLMPPICRFHPTCSHYTVEALHTHGLFRGGCLGLIRVLRCNPFSRGGIDLVPPPRPRASRAG